MSEQDKTIKKHLLEIPLIPKEENIAIEFFKIAKGSAGKMLTDARVEDIRSEYALFFQKFDLRDIQYSIISNKDTGIVSLIPHRVIDKFAIIGIIGKIF